MRYLCYIAEVYQGTWKRFMKFNLKKTPMKPQHLYGVSTVMMAALYMGIDGNSCCFLLLGQC